MSRYIATSAIRGANAIVGEAEALVADAIERLGPDTPVQFTNTAYYLPVTYAFLGHKVEKLGDLAPVVERARSLLHPEPAESFWLPYLGETLDSGVATLLAEEAIEGVRFAEGLEPQRIAWGTPVKRALRRQRRLRARRRRCSTAPSTTSSSAPGASSSSTAACPGSPPSSAAPRATRWRSRSCVSCRAAAS